MPSANIHYYTNYYNAFANTSSIASQTSDWEINSFVTGDITPYTLWRVAKTTGGTPVAGTPTGAYANGFDLGTFGTLDGGDQVIQYHIYPASKVLYYSNSTDATLRNGSSILSYGDSYTLGSTLIYSGSISPYTSWRIAFVTNNSPPFPTTIFGNTGDIASATSLGNEMYYVYPFVVCFLEGTQILCLKDDVETYLPIETMRTGTLVKTTHNGYKKVELIGNSKIQNSGTNERIADRLYKLTPSEYPDLKENLFITGGHSVLVNKITDKEREGMIKHLGDIFVTDKKFRLTALVDERAKPWASEGTYTIWHFALEDDNILINYGIYANGLLVESCSINTMRTKANLTIV